MIGAETHSRSYKIAEKKWVGKLMLVSHILFPEGCRHTRTVNGVTGYTQILDRDSWYCIGAEVEIVELGHEYGEWDGSMLICPTNSPKHFECVRTMYWNLAPKSLRIAP